MRLDLPEPDGPQMTMRAPRGTIRLMSLSRWNARYHLLRSGTVTVAGTQRSMLVPGRILSYSMRVMKERRMDTAEKLSITLPPEMVRTIKERVQAGAYGSTSEVIREAVRVWQRQEEEHAERLASIRARVQRSLADERPDVSMADAYERLAALHGSTVKSR